jgi:hypothetical protein
MTFKAPPILALRKVSIDNGSAKNKVEPEKYELPVLLDCML